MKTFERTRARELRRLNGMSMREIAAELGVSRSSVSHWVQGTVKIVVSRQAVIQTIYGALQELGGFERPAWAER